MAKKETLDIKALASAIKQKQAIETVVEAPKEMAVETKAKAIENVVADAPQGEKKSEPVAMQPQVQEEIKTEVDPKRTTQEQEPVASEQSKVVEKSVTTIKVASESNESFDLNEVINWKRPQTTGKKKLVELAKEYDTFFAKVKATTGVSTVKFVNYLIRDFLLKNPDFVQFINEESGRSPQLE